jgi:hypothetical protein
MGQHELFVWRGLAKEEVFCSITGWQAPRPMERQRFSVRFLVTMAAVHELALV